MPSSILMIQAPQFHGCWSAKGSQIWICRLSSVEGSKIGLKGKFAGNRNPHLYVRVLWIFPKDFTDSNMYSMRFLLWLQGHPTPPELTSDPVSQLHIRTPDQASLVAATKSATSRDGHDGATSLTKKKMVWFWTETTLVWWLSYPSQNYEPIRDHDPR